MNKSLYVFNKYAQTVKSQPDFQELGTELNLSRSKRLPRPVGYINIFKNNKGRN